MNSTLYSPNNRLEPQHVLKFRCRLDSSDGKDAHRDFSAAYYPRWRAMYVDEVRLILNKDIKTFPVFPFDCYLKPSCNNEEDYYYPCDIIDGATLVLGRTRNQRDRQHAAKKFVVTSVDVSQCIQGDSEALRKKQLSQKFPEDVVVLLLKVRDAFVARSGGVVELGIKELGRRFRVVDDNGDRRLSKVDFSNAVSEISLHFSKADVDKIFRTFDVNSDGTISFEEMLHIVRGPMNNHHKELVQLAFRKLDLDASGVVTIRDMESKYVAERHPDVLRGHLTARQVLTGFLSIWDTYDHDGVVTFAEFCDYYHGISASVDSDEVFEAVILSSWRIGF